MKHFTLTVLLFCSALVHAQLTGGITVTPFCNWQSPGALTCFVGGGSPPYTYMWSNGSTTANQQNTGPGNYCVTVTDANGNSLSLCDSVTSTVQAQLYTQNENCNGTMGMAWVDVTGGTLPYTINWCCPAQTGDTAFNLTEGYYYLQVHDSAGCFATSPNSWWGDSITFQIKKDLPYTYSIAKTPHNCPQLGSATVTVTGGTAPITYNWSTTPPQTTAAVTGLYGGNYTVTISDATPGCSVSVTVNIQNSNPLQATGTSTPEFCEITNGTATVIAQTGTAPYTYIWNTVPPQTTITATNLSSGVYTVTVIDANNCSKNQQVSVGYQSPIQPNFTKVNETCNTQNGSATVTPQLGTQPYVYTWSTGATGTSITNLNNGTYSVTISDAEGCTVAASGYVSDNPSFTVNITKTGTACNANTGSATANVTGATGPFAYKWSTVPQQTTAAITGLGVGYYTCTVTDATGCSGVYNTNITYATALSAGVGTVDAQCLTATGSAVANVGGGQAPYTYIWNTGATTQSVTNKVPGYYSVTITDANNCKAYKSGMVGSYTNMLVGAIATSASCIYVNDGSAVATVTNATPPVTYQWSNGQTGPNATGLNQAWKYTVKVTDANGCSASAQTAQIGYLSIACAAQVSGKVVKDNDKDCAFTTGDEGIPQTLVQAIPGYYDYTDANGDYAFVLPTGSYALTHNFPYHTFPLCPVGPIVLQNLSAGSITPNNNFYDTVRAALDLESCFNYLTPPRPGFQHQASILARNKGNMTVTATIEFSYDADVTYVTASAGPTLHDVANRKLYFTITNFFPNAQQYITLTFSTASTTLLGTAVDECVSITPVQNDVNFTNNSMCNSVEVVGSYDPNDKQVTPVGTGLPGYIDRSDSVLTYRIRFQNTGTYYAQHVVILDTLDEDLDIGSIDRIYASHNVRPDFFQNKILALYFDNIYLPDSNTNEPGSHGFVSFNIKVKPNLPHGTPIKNKGHIYFDYNAPIITNEVLNTINDPTGITEKPKADWKLYPNPTQGYLRLEVPDAIAGDYRIIVTDIIGRTIYTENKQLLAGNNQIELNLSDKNEGIYLLQLTGPNTGYSVKKFVLERR
jgi:hypothetical protein